MKRTLFVVVLFLVLAGGLSSCEGCRSSKGSQEAGLQDSADSALSVEALMALDTSYLGREIVVEGDVEHVCEHSGRRCFLSGGGDVGVRVEAGKAIGAFASDLIGHRVRVRGVLRGQEVPAERIAEFETTVAEREAAGVDSASCAAQRAMLSRWRRWMEQRGVSYYLQYYVDGESYAIVEE